ncbi:Bifunctional purine biosynthesis protein PurH [Coemansia sp. RSA 1813]|nr:Bifunctional purine biosynthesis protein PurH [Coemansia sp. RSA 1646]KAJ1774109.1 Bifunctional purine biosynthesis protein PurH [Coemansia sp. RSA 1843]KAJ2216806.1 Bifunctional purine biosynthesis protein PurH [Coemansia sp. RSA 487]KAJ2572878.1 Bifunctional purine biosynthesis protein PurH [Coemansia sp. RSA 1813]
MSVKAQVKSQDLGITRYQLFCVLAASVSSLNFGWNLAVTNIPGNIITKCLAGPQRTISGLPSCIPTTDFVWGIAVGAYALGALCGALSCTRFSNKYGRRSVLLYSNVIGLAATLVFALSINVAMVTAGRVLAGIAQGAANGTFTTYVVEITTPRARNSLASMTQMAVSTGMVLAFALSLAALEPPLWRVLFAVTGLLCLVSGALMLLCVESPRWLAMNGKDVEARGALLRLRKGSCVDITDELELMYGSTAPESNAASVVDLVLGRTPDNLRHQLLVAVALMFFQQASGISSIGFFSTTLFSSISTQPTTDSPVDVSKPTFPQILSVVLMVVGALATLGGMFLANYWGRRTLMLFAHGAMCVFCVFISVGSVVAGLSRMAISGVFLYFIVFFIGPGPLPWVVPNELTPTYATSALMAINNSVCYIGIFVVGLAFAPLLSLVGGYTFLIFASGNALAVVFLLFFLPETKGIAVADLVKIHSIGIHSVLRVGRKDDCCSGTTKVSSSVSVV